MGNVDSLGSKFSESFNGRTGSNNSTGGDDQRMWFSTIPTAEYSLNLIRKTFEQYRFYVKHNPILVSEVERALYWISYLISSTKFHNSRLISELLFSCSSLMNLFHDCLLRHSYKIDQHVKSPVRKIHISLQFIEYIQVFVEMAAIQMYGHYSKWLVISLIEIIKAVLRLFLLFSFEQGLTRRVNIEPLKRLKELEVYQARLRFHSMQRKNNQSPNHSVSSSLESVDEAVVLDDDDDHKVLQKNFESRLIVENVQLKNSGRWIRSIESAPPLDQRMWLTPVQTLHLKRLLEKQHRSSPIVTRLTRRRLTGEFLHIIRPLVYLASKAFIGDQQESSWGPYLLALGLDLTSLRLLQGSFLIKINPSTNYLMAINVNQQSDMIDEIWNWSETMEIQRRYFSLLLYLLRSPFYDVHTKKRLIGLLSLFADHIPLFGRLIQPFINYLPQWQKIFFNVWD